jgi:primosomal protein N' (replication factor Y)
MPILRLAIASPLRRIFDYLPPPGCDPAALQPGIRVLAPFGKRRVCAVLLEVAENTELEPGRLRAAEALIDSSPLISPSVLSLCEWATLYYKHPPGEIIAAALPPSLRTGRSRPPVGEKCWQLTAEGLGLPEGALSRAPRQAQLLALLQAQSPRPETEIRAAGISPAVLRELERKGLAEVIHRKDHAPAAVAVAGPSLNDAQQRAIDTITQSGEGFHCFLLEGVTGSGKTEVYLQLIERTLKAGRQALVLVPEIGLTPQTLQRFRTRFDANIVALNSGLTDSQRLSAWEAARSGAADIVIGTRSVIFTSLKRPGLIVVDEEHDPSFKQQDGFRYSARDLAVKRGQLEGTCVVLGSATPSLESLANTARGRYQRLVLDERAGAARPPEIELLDLRHKPLEGGLSEPMLAAVSRTLEAGEQALLFLNRRGYAPTLQCHDCGFVAGCPHCDARLTLHRQAAELRCHHCDWRCPLPGRCPDCQSSRLQPSGVGTEQLEQVLAQHFPDYPRHRVDRDAVQRRGALDEVLGAVASGDPCLLLGTQMLTKGHHFPAVTLVGVLDTDAGLFSADFRGPERMGQLLIQVAGRAGRAERPGKVLMQTHYPDHPLLKILLEEGYHAFAEHLLLERQRHGLPPFGNLLLMRAEAPSNDAADQFLAGLREQAAARLDPGVRLLGPIPAPMQRRGGRYRSQLAIHAGSRAAAQAAGDVLVSLAEAQPSSRALRWSLDVDPLEMA